MKIQNKILNKPVNNIVGECKGFEWDKGNINKNQVKHKVSCTESEQIFFNTPLIIAKSDKKTNIEIRCFALGHTNASWLLFVVFTIRNEYIRIISARDMSKKEREVYKNVRKTTP